MASTSRFDTSRRNDHWRQCLHQSHRLYAHCHHPTNQPHDVLFVVGAIRVTGDAAALIGADLILVDHPLQRGSVAQAILEALRWNVGESQTIIVSGNIQHCSSSMSLEKDDTIAPLGNRVDKGGIIKTNVLVRSEDANGAKFHN